MGGKNPSRKKKKGKGEGGEKISVQRLGSQNSINPYTCRISTNNCTEPNRIHAGKKTGGRNSEITLLKQQLLFHFSQLHVGKIIIL
jgi:hypothetical protein